MNTECTNGTSEVILDRATIVNLLKPGSSMTFSDDGRDSYLSSICDFADRQGQKRVGIMG